VQLEFHAVFTRRDVEAFLTEGLLAAQSGLSTDTRGKVELALAWISWELDQPDPRWDEMRWWGWLAKRELALAAHPTVMMPLLEMPWP
jgi:hypothetical protein